jgi:4-aminobutyrate aminotransferase/4-aminobutyrate aminotransferase/(S)-3-amino-2-methylpropionate transaminase
MLFKSEVDPESVACIVLEPVQGEGGFIPMPLEYPRRLREICDEHGILYLDDEIQSGVCRTGPIWAIEHYGVEPDLVVTGKSIGGGLPLAGVTGRAEILDAVHPGGLGGTFGGNRSRAPQPSLCSRRYPIPLSSGAPVELGNRIWTRLEEIASRVEAVGDIRGLGPMVALELVRDRKTKAPAADLATATVTAARERGLILLTCGLHSNVVRVLAPLNIGEHELDEGLHILETSINTSAG